MLFKNRYIDVTSDKRVYTLNENDLKVIEDALNRIFFDQLIKFIHVSLNVISYTLIDGLTDYRTIRFMGIFAPLP